jgi:hypothetical protein
MPEQCAAADGLRILKIWHLASLDAPTVAVTWACALAWAAHVHPGVWPVAPLGLTVWAIYIVDRLLDARAGLRGPGLDGSVAHRLKERHWFHWRHRRVLSGIAAVAGGAAACMVLPRLGAGALRPDGAVAAATLMYFGGVHGRQGLLRRMLRRAGEVVPRECVVGAIFTAGCLLPALSSSEHLRVAVELIAPVFAMAALASLNVRAIGRWEGDGQRTDVSAAALGLAAVSLGGAAVLLGAEPRAAALLAMAAASAGLLALLDLFRNRLQPVTLRAAADLILLTPALLMPLALLAVR